MMRTTIFERMFLRFGLLTALLVCSLLCANSALAQGWLRHYPSGTGTEPAQMVVTPNGDFVFGGVDYSSSGLRFYLQRNDAMGNKLWFKAYQINTQTPGANYAQAYCLAYCPDGGFVIGGVISAGSTPSEVALKMSATGDSLWTFLPAPGVYGFINAITVAPDGNLLIGGTRKISETGFQLTPILQKVNASDGTLQWFHYYDQNALPQVGSSTLYAPDGSIWQTSMIDDSVFVRHMDADGNLLQVIPVKYQPQIQYPSLRHVPNGFSLTMLGSNSPVGNIGYRRFDYDGNLISAKNTSGVAFLVMVGAEIPSGSAFTITRIASNGQYETPRFYKMDFDGHVNPAVFPLAGFSLNTSYLAQNVQQAPDGGFIFVGVNLGQPTFFAFKTDSLGHLDPATIEGNVFRDADLDCLYSAGDTSLFPVQIRATDLDNGTEWYETTDSTGHYSMTVLTGDYEVQALAPAGASGWWSACPSQTATLPVPGDTLSLADMGLQPLADCPFLQLQLGTWLFRPCSTSVVQVSVFNAGTAGVDSALVTLSVDQLLHFDSSSAQVLNMNDSTITFKTGPIPPLQSATFSVNFSVDCAAQIGQVICVDGHVFPDSLCAPLDSLWDGAELKVDALCGNDSIHFRVSNIGTGDMAQPSNFVIIEDYIILRVAPLQLPSGQDTTISLPNPNGHTYYGRIKQTPGFPGMAFSADGKDYCNGNGDPGMLLQYPLFSGGPFDTRFCDEVRASCDPNDKRGFPAGYGAAHYIDRGVPIEYMIRFQNTGNDTAFNIVVLDSLPSELDLSTLRIGTASHPFSWEWAGSGVLAFHFANIQLPDSTTNEPASHGFVQFGIMPKTTLPNGTEVRNRAAIYFDYNAPVYTEYARHTVDSNFILLKNKEAIPLPAQISISPNPASELAYTHVEIPGGKTPFPLRLTITDVLGRVLRQEQLNAPDYILRRGDLPSGMCWLKWEREDGVLLGIGKVVWVD